MVDIYHIMVDVHVGGGCIGLCMCKMWKSEYTMQACMTGYFYGDCNY